MQTRDTRESDRYIARQQEENVRRLSSMGIEADADSARTIAYGLSALSEASELQQ